MNDYYNRKAWLAFPTLKVGDTIVVKIEKTGLSRLKSWLSGEPRTVTEVFQVAPLPETSEGSSE